MLGKGVKRKYHELEEAKEMGFATLYCEQRQSFLNISLLKLQSCRNVKEPKLLRSVLICNTLKQIHKELQMENTGKVCGSMVLTTPYLAQSNDAEEIPSKEESQRAFSKRSVSVNTDNKAKLLEGNKENVCIENACSRQSSNVPVESSRKDCHDCENSETTMETVETETAESLPSNMCEMSDVSEVQNSFKTETDPRTVKSSTETNSSCMLEYDIPDSTLSLLEACEEEFSDIDVSLYDFDLLPPLSPKSTEDIRRVSTVLPDSAPSPNLCSSSCRSDIMDDIDQIMNVLIEVGM
ncbi:cell division cycle-associated protein 4-like [Ptychodera flava]|uniref:cell division cycle-associated protein 4-like n=1 Tax=Ptychodera flava TaxID=63121 RepID=UPI003969CE8B